MPDDTPPSSSRREFLSGKAFRQQVEDGGEQLADAIVDAATAGPPVAGDTMRLATRAMACEFAVILNPDRGEQISAASEALDTVHALEQQMTVYREGSELSVINREAFAGPVTVEPGLFRLLQTAKRIAEETGGAFDPTSGPVIALWRQCRQDSRIPTEAEITAVLQSTGVAHLHLDEASKTVAFLRDGVSWDLGGIGKGYALDRIAERLQQNGITDFLIHGGHSSILARGNHAGQRGWPVGLRDPQFPQDEFATIMLRDCALSSSGTGVQHFRHEGKRYGHILDPRTGRSVEGMLSVTVTAPTAAEADALSTAFFVMGLENARRYCDNRKDIGAVLIPPVSGRMLKPVVCNLDDATLLFAG